MSGDGERASRPSSLQLEAPPPEREPLHFDVELIGAPPEVEQLVNNIKQVAEDFLYHWKTFPIVLPPSRFTGPGNKPSDIIIPPPCDELDAAALDAGLEPQPLSPKQLYSIRDKGEFEVPSRHFPGQTHVWRVAGWLQRGRVRAREELYTYIAHAAAVILIVARDRLLRDEPLSVRAGLRSLLGGLHRIMDLIIGMPSMEARDLEKKIREERSRYLVAELICKPEHQEDISALAAWVTRAMRRAASEKANARELPRPVPRVPFLYTTPQRTQVDLRLYRRDVLRRAASPLQNILERESRGWFLHFRERHAAQLASQKMPLKEIEMEVSDAAFREYVTRVCNAVLASEPLAALGADIPELLAAQLRAAAIYERAEEGVRRRIEAGVRAAEARLRVAHPVASWCGAWRRERLAAHSRRLHRDLRWAANEDALANLETHRLHMHRYFLSRDMSFVREREPLLARELAGALSCTRRFAWRTRRWRPQAWRVARVLRGRQDAVPTVVTQRHTSIVTPRSDPSQPVYLLETDTVRETTTRWPGWRLANMCHRMWSWTWNLMFFLGVVVPWCSPLSLRTLVRTTPFIPDYELSQVNGTLFPKRSSETETMWSRLLVLWRYVSKQRSRFETEPDTGLLGKGVSRAAHRVLQYGCVGALGSLALLLLLPAACVAVSAASALAALAAPLWAPPLALLAHAFISLLYDVDCPRPGLNRWFPMLEATVWRVCTLGLLQPLCALLIALVLCPLCSLCMLVGGVVWCGLRSGWEAAAWRGVIMRGARVPAHDSAFCSRVAGPAHAHPPRYTLTCAQAVAAACARAEAEALAEWCVACERAIERPLRDYRHFVDACFGPFSVQIAKSGAYKQVERECSELVHSLREKVSARRAALALPLSDAARQRCRLLPADLTAAIEAAGAELARVWGEAPSREDWWTRRGLDCGAYTALAANTLSEAFDPDILVPLEEGAARLPLESGVGARAWEQRCLRTAPPDLVAGAAPWGAGGAPRVPPPSLDLQAFSPRAHRAPPLPHPATVALVLHNRDSDNPIPLDSELCAEILKNLEDAPDSDDKRDSVERYRGGGSSTGSSSDAEEEEERPPICRVERGAITAGGACRWTLTGRGVRLRADLASPEDVTLDAERRGTSV